MYSFAKERDNAFIEFVMNDNDKPLMKYIRKYKVPYSDKPQVFKASIYKAVQECTNIPAEVKVVAAQKCIALGFNPTMR